MYDDLFGGLYKGVGYLVGFLSFVFIWIYAFESWGFLIGLAVGWLPAVIGGFILGLLWPLPVAVLVLALLNS